MMQKTELLIKSKEICIFKCYGSSLIKSSYKQSKIHSDIQGGEAKLSGRENC